MNISVFSCSLVGFGQQNHFGSVWEKIMVRIKENKSTYTLLISHRTRTAMIAKTKLISEVRSNETPAVSRRERALRHNTLRWCIPRWHTKFLGDSKCCSPNDALCVFVCCAGCKCSIQTMSLFSRTTIWPWWDPLDSRPAIRGLKKPPDQRKSSILTLELLRVPARDERNTLAIIMRVWKIQCIQMKRVEIMMQEWLEKSRRKLSHFCKSIILKTPLHRGEWFSWFKMKYCCIYVLCKNLMHVQVQIRKMCEMAIVKEKEIHAKPWASKVFPLC